MTTETKPRRGRRFLKILLLLLLLMVVIVVFLPTIASTGMGKSWVTGRLASALDRDVTLGEFDAGWGSGVRFGELSVANPEGFSPEPLFAAKSLLLKPGIASALGGSLDVEIELRNATIRIEKSADGRSNLDGMMASGKKPETEEEEAAEPAPMNVRVIIENLSLAYVDHGKPEGERESTVEDLDLTLTLTGDEPGTIAGALEATIRRVASSGLESEAITIHGKAEKGVFRLEQMNVPFGGGQVVASGQMDLAKRSGFSSKFEIKDVHLARGFPLLDYVLPIFSLEGGGTAQGTLSANVTLEGSEFGLEALKRDLTGGGDIKVTNGQVSGNAIIAQALKLAGENGALEFDEVATVFEIKGGRVHTPKVKLGQGSLRLRLMGSVGLDGSVDYILGMKPKGSTWKKIRKELGEDGLMPIRISGTIGDLDVEEPDPEAMLKRLLEEKTGGLLGDQAGGLLEDLFGK